MNGPVEGENVFIPLSQVGVLDGLLMFRNKEITLYIYYGLWYRKEAYICYFLHLAHCILYRLLVAKYAQDLGGICSWIVLLREEQ